MNQGILVFAHDNETTPYGLLAVWQAKRIKSYLDKPVSIVTDTATIDNLKNRNIAVDEIFDQIILTDVEMNQCRSDRTTEKISFFKNTDRTEAWNLTPYDETIVIDTDIIIQSTSLNLLWNSEEDLLVCNKCKDIFARSVAGFDYLSEYGIKFYWATIFYFRKNLISKLFFDKCKQIKQQYRWYSFLHDLRSPFIRNDYIWSIALHELGGTANSMWAKTIPYTLHYLLEQDQLIKLEKDNVVAFSSDKLAKLENLDIHAMNKLSLMSFVEQEVLNV